MLEVQAKHVSTERQKTQTKISFSFEGDVSDLELMQLEKAPGWLYFSADKIAQERQAYMRDRKIGETPAGKSGSKELRGALYDYWFKNINGSDFEDWYAKKIQSLITQVKNSGK